MNIRREMRSVDAEPENCSRCPVTRSRPAWTTTRHRLPHLWITGTQILAC